jgi:hypothetical protein
MHVVSMMNSSRSCCCCVGCCPLMMLAKLMPSQGKCFGTCKRQAQADV